MTRAELLALAERVETGETGYELSDACWVAAGWRNDGRYWYSPTDGLVCAVIMPDLSASIDAQAELPAQVVHVIWRGTVDGKYEATALATPDADGERWSGTGCASTEPAARLAAILRAMAEKEPEA